MKATNQPGSLLYWDSSQTCVIRCCKYGGAMRWCTKNMARCMSLKMVMTHAYHITSSAWKNQQWLLATVQKPDPSTMMIKFHQFCTRDLVGSPQLMPSHCYFLNGCTCVSYFMPLKLHPSLIRIWLGFDTSCLIPRNRFV